ncbi:murein hydrolase activator EnvC [Nocardiopsis sp. CNT312]|uniref:murein hydrolase activator EnvC family protein n=1 Tax=Nocardiopsis sp. CNT312 TaxID=1137268 RepID=UPI0004B23BCE|nr:M23 family metallopeptidase [Nocardiopsis sp. CNT312]
MSPPSLRYLPRLLAVLSIPLLSLAPDRTAAEGVWEWPVEPPTPVLRPFDPPEERWLPGHRGVDLAAEPGAPVHAPGPGHVHYVGEVAGTPLVSIAHGPLRTTYLPVESPLVRGDPVRAGEVIGTVAAEPAHCPGRPCLHWGLLRGKTYLDPLGLLGLGEVRLLPLTRRGEEFPHGGGDPPPTAGPAPGPLPLEPAGDHQGDQARGWARR